MFLKGKKVREVFWDHVVAGGEQSLGGQTDQGQIGKKMLEWQTGQRGGVGGGQHNLQPLSPMLSAAAVLHCPEMDIQLGYSGCLPGLGSRLVL